MLTHVGHLFHEIDHLIVALGLLAKPRKESFTRRLSDDRPWEVLGAADIPLPLQFASRSASSLINARIGVDGKQHQLRPNVGAGRSETYISSHGERCDWYGQEEACKDEGADASRTEIWKVVGWKLKEEVDCLVMGMGAVQSRVCCDDGMGLRKC